MILLNNITLKKQEYNFSKTYYGTQIKIITHQPTIQQDTT